MRDVLIAINSVPAGIAFMIDNDEVLNGIVTDGDFRRLLLGGKTLDEKLTKDDLGDFVFAKKGESIQELLHKSSRKVRIIPIVDEQMHLVDFFQYEHRVRMIPVAEPDLRGKEFEYLSDAFLSTWISSAGKYINDLESGFSSYCETKHGIAVSNGTVALHLALVALGIGEGDEVIVPDLTFAATINTVLHANATPVIVDIDESSWCIDPVEIEKAIGPKTKAIIPVHLYGQPCDMDAIMSIARKHNLYVIEDAAEAHGARYKGHPVGSFGDIACFSFFGNKIITTGEGGMCLTNSDALNDRMRTLRDHGMNKQKKYWHDEVGFNYRMTNLQAAIGCAQLERIDKILDDRKGIEQSYRQLLSSFNFVRWQEDIADRDRVTWLVCATVDHGIRELVMNTLRNNGVDVRPFFYPLSEMDIYKPYILSNKVSSSVAYQGISLPTINNIDFDTVKKAFSLIQEHLSQ
ncbi:MAG: aminotransferase class I/II-fold pyridoxal phosphate-dependent enzyme [Flavobacteriales bacterium]